jgi:hypothetical protein
MSIYDLPLELLRQIVSETQEGDWKSLRFVCKAIEHLVTPLLFEKANVWIESQSFSRYELFLAWIRRIC